MINVRGDRLGLAARLVMLVLSVAFAVMLVLSVALAVMLVLAVALAVGMALAVMMMVAGGARSHRSRRRGEG